jgi:hypothetical protein
MIIFAQAPILVVLQYDNTALYVIMCTHTMPLYCVAIATDCAVVLLDCGSVLDTAFYWLIMSLALFSASHMHSAWLCLCLSTIHGWPVEFPDNAIAHLLVICRAVAPPILVALFLLRFTLAHKSLYVPSLPVNQPTTATD